MSEEITLRKIVIDIDEEKKPATIRFDEDSGEYIIDIPEDIQVGTLIDLVDEVKRILEIP